jgi:hypothetical protein
MCAIELCPGTRAALYARVSSEKQAQTIASQVEALQERLRQDGTILDPELSFIDDGYSGATLILVKYLRSPKDLPKSWSQHMK